MRDLDTAGKMLAAAQRDLQALRNMRNPEEFAAEIFGFHTQQAVEKTLKAWLCIKGSAFQRTHSIRLLLNLLEQSGEKVAHLWELVGLTAFAVQLRYDAFEVSDEDVDRAELLQQATALYSRVQELFEKIN